MAAKDLINTYHVGFFTLSLSVLEHVNGQWVMNIRINVTLDFDGLLHLSAFSNRSKNLLICSTASEEDMNFYT